MKRNGEGDNVADGNAVSFAVIIYPHQLTFFCVSLLLLCNQLKKGLVKAINIQPKDGVMMLRILYLVLHNHGVQ